MQAPIGRAGAALAAAAALMLVWACAHGRGAAGPGREEALPPAAGAPSDTVGASDSLGAADSIPRGDSLSPVDSIPRTIDLPPPQASAGSDSTGELAGGGSGARTTLPLLPAWPDSAPARPGSGGPGDELFGRIVAHGSFEIRSLATGAVLGHEDWELFEDEAGFRSLRAENEMQADGSASSRTATVTVSPDLAFVEADLGSNTAGVESYAAFRRAGDLLTVDAHGDAEGETRQQVRFPDDGVFVSQVFSTRGWELAPFDRPDEVARPAYLVGSAPGVLVGEIGTLAARRSGPEQLRLRPGVFRTLRFDIPPADAPATAPGSGEGADDDMLDRWWILAGSRIPAAADLPSLGLRVELVELAQESEPVSGVERGPVLARGIYHHRLPRRTEPLAIETWSLSAEPDGGYLLESEIAYADGPRLVVRALADSAFQVRQVVTRRTTARGTEASSIAVAAAELRGESRGTGVGVAEQTIPLAGPVVFRASAAALEGWALVPMPRRESGAGTGSGADTVAADTVAKGTEAANAGETLTYWLPAGAHPLGTLLRLPPDVDLGPERVPTPARTFSTRRYASPAETPPAFRAVRWIFGPYRLPARVLFPGVGREAILVRYETPE